MARDPAHRSKFLSHVLRHRPDRIGITLDAGGWTPVATLLYALERAGEPMSMTDLETVVATSDKQRFAFNDDRSLIRANQGHSVPVDLGLAPADPPPVLFHGTTGRFMAAIARQGLRRGRRHHVHLHADPEIAADVGRRRGPAVVLAIDAASMHHDGFVFYRSANDVWLTDRVPPGYLQAAADLQE